MTARMVPTEMLLQWLDENPDKLARHLAKHPADEARLELSTALPEAQRNAIAETLTPSESVLEALRDRLTVDPATTAALSVAADLLGLGLRTVSLLFGAADPLPSTSADEGDDEQ
ncbi:MAG: hypothetical protein AB7L13_16775 [Acidimicrobiia bacterium]